MIQWVRVLAAQAQYMRSHPYTTRVRPCDFSAVNLRASQLLRLAVRQPSSSSVRNTISRDCVESNRPGCPTPSSSLEARASPNTCVHTPYTHTHTTYKGSRLVFSRDLGETGMGNSVDYGRNSVMMM